MNQILSFLAVLLLAALSSVSGTASFFTGGMCKHLDGGPSQRLNNPCVGVVNYRYFVGENVNDNILMNRVNARLNFTNAIGALSSDCQARYLAYVCSTVYLKCEDSVTDLGLTATYTNSVYSSGIYNLPFQKPCQSTCTNMVSTCGSMGAAIIGYQKDPSYLLGQSVPPICLRTTDYSNGDGGGQTTVVYNGADYAKCFTPRIIPTSGNKEYYLDKENGPCKGLVNQFYVLPATSLNPDYSPFQLPYTVQNILNNRINTVLGKLPTWLKDDCALSLRKYLCYAAFPSVETTTLQSIVTYSNQQQANAVSATVIGVLNQANMLQNTLGVPQFPHYTYCTGFNTTCHDLVLKAPAIMPNCNATSTSNGVTINRFPAAKQTVMKFNINLYDYRFPSRGWSNPLTATIYVPSSPNSNGYYDASVYSYEPDCPPGFVIPQNPDNEEVKWVSFSACATSCNLPIWTNDEWSNTINIARRLPVASIILGLIVILFVLHKQDWENGYHIVCYMVLGIFASASSSNLVGYDLDYGYDHAMCFDNAVQREQYQGQTPCSGQAIILTYTFLACCSTIWMMAVYWIFKTTKLAWITHTVWYKAHEFFWIFVLPIIPVTYAGANQLYGYSKSLPYCFVQTGMYAPQDASTGVVGVPVLIVTILTHVSMSAHDFYIGMCRCGKPYNPRIEHMDGTPVNEKHPNFAIRFVVMLSFLVFVPYLVAEGNSYRRYDDYVNSFEKWTACVFKNYDGSVDSYYDECGGRPSLRPFVGLARFIINSVISSNLVIAPAYLLFYNISTTWYPFTALNYEPAPQDEKEKEVELTEKA